MAHELSPVIVGTPSGCDLWIGEKDVELSLLTGEAGSWSEDIYTYNNPFTINYSDTVDDLFDGAYISPTALGYLYSYWFICATDYSATLFESKILDTNEDVYYSKYTVSDRIFNPANLTHIEEGILEDAGANRHWDRYILTSNYTVYRVAAMNPVATENQPVDLF